MYKKYFKRILDIICALAAMIVFCWLYAIVAILVMSKMGSPVIFCQDRPGKNEKIFKMYKFRSMTDARDESGEFLPDEDRLTRFGKLLRSTSLDELPEAWNILKGDMSIIGPRPQLVRDMVFMTPEQRKRHMVRPGLSGLAQVRGRNSISWENKLATDLEYIKKITFFYDLKIMLFTVKKFLYQDDISADGIGTAEDLGDYLFHTGAVDQDKYDKEQEKAKQLLSSVR